MKTTIQFPVEPVTPEYPKMGVIKTYEGRPAAEGEHRYVVLFIRSGAGVVVAREPAAVRSLGYYNSAWDMALFAPFRGTVTLNGGDQ